MLKPLLRTIPTMSGNVKLACNLLDYRTVGPNQYETEVRYAKLLPLSSSLYQHKVEAELTGGSWEYDLKKFYSIYNDVFFEPYFNYNRGEILKIDKTTNQYVRNTDFEMGVKRVSWVKNGCQFAFFAPFYFEGVDDLPRYFNMTVRFSTAVHTLVKSVKINITDNHKSVRNYLYHYLTKYAKGIDSNVCFMLPDSKQATYYGIDLTRGGFVKCVDNGVNKLYTTQTTIHNFDATICTGFKRNKLALKQVMPLAFYFNIDELLTPAERNLYRNGSIEFSGYYVNQRGISCPWYDFNIDYDLWKESILALNDENGLMQWFPGYVGNIMDCKFPALNDKRFVEYQFSNKMTSSYCRWKLKYSSDEHPFITNMSTAFSKNQNSNYKYGQYPVSFSAMDGLALPILHNSTYYYNLIFPLSSNTKWYDIYNTNSTDKYQNIFNNYCLNWFNVIDKVDDALFKNDKLWQNVVDNCVYYNGVLYDLSNIYSELIEPKKIDKFAMFVKTNINFMNEEEVDKLKFSNYMLNRQVVEKSLHPNALSNLQLLNWGIGNHSLNYKNYLYDNEEYTGSLQDNANKDSLEFNKIFTYSENNTGHYISFEDYGMDYYELNKYYDYDKVSSYISYMRDNFFDMYEDNISSTYPGVWDPAFREIIEDNAFTYMPVFADPSEYCINSYEILPINRSYMIAYNAKIDVNTYAYVANLNRYVAYSDYLLHDVTPEEAAMTYWTAYTDAFGNKITYTGYKTYTAYYREANGDIKPIVTEYTYQENVLDADGKPITYIAERTYVDANGDTVPYMSLTSDFNNVYIGYSMKADNSYNYVKRLATYMGVKPVSKYVLDANNKPITYTGFVTYTSNDEITFATYIANKTYIGYRTDNDGNMITYSAAVTDINGIPVTKYDKVAIDVDGNKQFATYEAIATYTDYVLDENGERIPIYAEHDIIPTVIDKVTYSYFSDGYDDVTPEYAYMLGENGEPISYIRDVNTYNKLTYVAHAYTCNIDGHMDYVYDDDGTYMTYTAYYTYFDYTAEGKEVVRYMYGDVCNPVTTYKVDANNNKIIVGYRTYDATEYIPYYTYVETIYDELSNTYQQYDRVSYNQHEVHIVTGGIYDGPFYEEPRTYTANYYAYMPLTYSAYLTYIANETYTGYLVATEYESYIGYMGEVGRDSTTGAPIFINYTYDVPATYIGYYMTYTPVTYTAYTTYECKGYTYDYNNTYVAYIVDGNGNKITYTAISSYLVYTYASGNVIGPDGKLATYVGYYYAPIEGEFDSYGNLIPGSDYEFEYMKDNFFFVDNDNYSVKKPSFIAYYNAYSGNIVSYFSCGKYEYLHALYGSTFYTKRRAIRSSELNKLAYEPFQQTYLRPFCTEDYSGIYQYGLINEPTSTTYKLWKSCQHTQEFAASLINAYLAQCDIYEFNPVLHNNGEIYTSNVFKKRYANIGKFYGEQVAYSEVKNDKNVLYASRYNLNAIFKKYSGVLSYSYFTTYTDADGTVLKDYYETKHSYTYDWIYDVATSTYQCAYTKKYNIPYMVTYNYDNIENAENHESHYTFNHNEYSEFYCKFLNKQHIYYWYGELAKDEAMKLPENWHITWKSNIFIKRRVLVHTTDGLNVQDEFVPLVEAGYLFAQRVDPEWFLSFKKFYANIIEDTTHGLFYFAGCESEKFELVFKDIFFRVDKTLWDIIGCEDKHYKDIYIYRIETPIEYDQNYVDAGVKTRFIGLDDYASYSSRYSDTDTTLTPLFYDIFEQDEVDEAIYANYKLHNISKTEYSWPEYDAHGDLIRVHFNNNYRYNANDTLYMVSITDEERENFGIHKTYEEYSYCGSGFSIERNDLGFNKDLCMSTYKDANGVNYGFYVIQANIDNTSNTFRVDAQTSLISKSSIREVYEYINNINAIYYINGVNIVENPEYGKLLFKNYAPFLNLNLLNNLNSISTVLKPNSFNIDMIYKQSLIDNTNGSTEINLSLADPNKITKQNLFRYTHNIVPYITPRNIISNYYYLKLKNVEKTLLERGIFNSIGDSPIYKKTIYIDSFTPYNVYTPSPNEKEIRSFNNVDYQYTPLEYKHFNVSKYVNIDSEFFIRLDGKYKYEELHELESEEHTISIFAGYVNTGRVTKFNEDEILFLYKKYKVEYDTKSIGLDYSRTEKLYTLTYKFSLL